MPASAHLRTMMQGKKPKSMTPKSIGAMMNKQAPVMKGLKAKKKGY